MTYPPAVLERARATRLLSLDVDGVLTDGRLYYLTGGGEAKVFSTQDGAAVKMLMGTGVAVAIITGRASDIVPRRAKELGITHLYEGVADKTVALTALAQATGIPAHQMAHVGDDLPDLPLFNRVGLRITVPAAHPLLLERADYVTTAPPGLGAVREVCHLIMSAQNTWTTAVGAFDR